MRVDHRVLIGSALVVNLATGCAGCAVAPDDGACRVNGERYDIGEEIDDPAAPAGCEGCVCEDDEQVDCPSSSSCARTCLDGAVERDVGESWTQGGVRCTCTLAGGVSCEALPCVPGESRAGPCGSTCSCDTSGQWVCPDVYCCAGGAAEAAAPCMPSCMGADGLQHFTGETWAQGDEVCTCDFGAAFCRAAECRWGELQWAAGTTQTLEGCGECECTALATIACPSTECLGTCTEYDANGAPIVRLVGEEWTAPAGECLCTGRGVFCCAPDTECVPASCDDAGTERSVGETWQSDEGVCSCSPLLVVECNASCPWLGVAYVDGENVPVADGCTCSCGGGGLVTCLEEGCLPTSCTDGASGYSIGLDFGAGDGCNHCLCSQDGQLYCTDRMCGPAGCEYAGTLYVADETFPSADGCNTCTCDASGQVLCTQSPCADVECFDGAEVRAVGETFWSADGCELCLCSSDGFIYCTARCGGE